MRRTRAVGGGVAKSFSSAGVSVAAEAVGAGSSVGAGFSIRDGARLAIQSVMVPRRHRRAPRPRSCGSGKQPARKRLSSAARPIPSIEQTSADESQSSGSGAAKSAMATSAIREAPSPPIVNRRRSIQ